MIPIDDNRCVIFYDKVYIFNYFNEQIVEILDFSREGVHAPLAFGGCCDEKGNIYFGEYQNERPYAPRVIKISVETGCWSIAYTFPVGRIKHIHSITHDQWRDRLWVSTGDRDDEAGLFFSDDGFETLNCLGSGDQGWRMVSLVPQKERLIWGSDLGRDVKDPFQSNYIYEYDFRTCKRRILQQVTNPIYYSYVSPQGKIFFGTTYEPGSVVNNVPKAGILYSENGQAWKEIVSFPYKYKKRPYGTKYGTIFFPKGQAENERVYFVPLNVEKYDGALMCLDL